MKNDPLEQMLEDIQGINIRPSMDIETVEIEDSVLPDGNHVHKEKHMKNGVESV